MKTVLLVAFVISLIANILLYSSNADLLDSIAETTEALNSLTGKINVHIVTYH